MRLITIVAGAVLIGVGVLAGLFWAFCLWAFWPHDRPADGNAASDYQRPQ